MSKEAKKGVEEIEIDPPSPILYPHHFDPNQASSSNDPPSPIRPREPRRANPLSHGGKHSSRVTLHVDPEDDCNPDGTSLIREDPLTSHVTTTLDKSLKQGEQILEGGEKLGLVFQKVGNHLTSEMEYLRGVASTIHHDLQCYTDESWEVLRDLRTGQEEIAGKDDDVGRLGRIQKQVEDMGEKQLVIIDQLVALIRVVQEALNVRIGQGYVSSRSSRRRRSEMKSESLSSTSSTTSPGRSHKTREGDACEHHPKRRR